MKQTYIDAIRFSFSCFLHDNRKVIFSLEEYREVLQEFEEKYNVKIIVDDNYPAVWKEIYFKNENTLMMFMLEWA